MQWCLSRIDDLSRRDHFALSEADECYYFGDYTPGKDWSHSEMNQLISNLKKNPEVRLRNPNEWWHKTRAIRDAANAIRRLTTSEECCYVPVPPSKIDTHPEYDDRLVQILEQSGVKYCQPISQIESTDAVHVSGVRKSERELIENYQVDEGVVAELRCPLVIVFDDVLRMGTHFHAVKDKLAPWLEPETKVIGLFIARCVDDSPFDAA